MENVALPLYACPVSGRGEVLSLHPLFSIFAQPFESLRRRTRLDIALWIMTMFSFWQQYLNEAQVVPQRIGDGDFGRRSSRSGCQERDDGWAF